MSLQVSTGYKGEVATLFKSLFDGAVLRVFSGVRPATADAVQPDTLLGTITRDGAGLVFAVSGPYVQKPLADGWSLVASAAGNAAWWRLCFPDDDGRQSYELLRVDGDVGLPGSGAEIVMPDLAIASGGTYTMNQFLYTIPPIIGA